MTATPEVRKFRALAQAYLEEWYCLFPQEASELGLHQYDGLLGENDARTHLAHRTLVAATLRGIEALADSAFAGDDWLDRRGMLALLRTTLQSNVRETWRTNPQVHCDSAVHSIFSLVVRGADRLTAALPAIESRLAGIPRYLAQGAACVRLPVPLWTRLAVQACEGTERFLAELAEQLVPLSPEPERTGALLDGAMTAFRRYARTVGSKDPGPANGYAMGVEGFEHLIRERTGLPYSLREVEALGLRQVALLTTELAGEARRFGRKKAGQIIDEAAARWTPHTASLMAEYERVTEAMRQRFAAADLVSFPKGERCRVMPVPSFLQHQFPTAAYLQPGAYDRDQTGIFWVNDLGAAQANPNRRAAEVRQHFGMEFTCAHEAYPGHHLQFVIQNQHPSRLRRLFHHAIFYEGWTLWCEKMAVDHAIIDLPEARLIQLHDALWRAHRIGIDCGLHAGTLSVAGAMRRLQEGVGFTAARARGDVNWYTSSPTVPMSYLLGRLEVERLHAHLVGRQGWTLRRFNDWALSFGALPWSWIREAELRPEDR